MNLGVITVHLSKNRFLSVQFWPEAGFAKEDLDRTRVRLFQPKFECYAFTILLPHLAFCFPQTIPTLVLLINLLQEMVSEIAMKWTKVARTGAIEAKFTGVDVSTMMFTMQNGQDTLEVRFIFLFCGSWKIFI